jgi:hypothetical protein
MGGMLALPPQPAGIVSVADMDNNGRPDMVAGARRGRVGVWLDGAAGPATRIPVAGDVAGIATGDFDGDGDTDVAVAGAKTVAILRGDGRGGLRAFPGRPLVVGRTIWTLVAGRFDGDRRADLLIGTGLGETETLAHGDGHGSFALARRGVACGSCDSAVAADVDGDGRDDLLVAHHHGGGGLTVFRSGTHRVRPNVATGPYPIGVAVADLDGDGRPDAAVAVPSRGVRILLGDGRGRFTPRNLIGNGKLHVRFAETVVAADLDHDGDVDLSVQGRDGGPVAVVRNDGRGALTPDAPPLKASDVFDAWGPSALLVGG